MNDYPYMIFGKRSDATEPPVFSERPIVQCLGMFIHNGSYVLALVDSIGEHHAFYLTAHQAAALAQNPILEAQFFIRR